MDAYGSLKFEEAIASLKKKVNLGTDKWYEVYAEAHAKAFMVAGAKGEILESFRVAVEKAVADGMTIQAFKKEFKRIAEETGWGFTGTADWRSRIIFDTNVRQSYNAGRERQLADPELMKRRPYGLYRHGGSKEPRVSHLEKDGWVVPLSDPWWNTWSPSNGWNCSCKKFALSESDVKRRGLKIINPPPVETRPVKLANGDVKNVPVGIDPGFEYRPGGDEVRDFYSRLSEKAKNMPPGIGKQIQADLDKAMALRKQK